MTPVPKGKRETGYRKEKITPVPKMKNKTGYRKEKFRRTKSYFWVMCKRRKYVMLKVKKWVDTRQKKGRKGELYEKKRKTYGSHVSGNRTSSVGYTGDCVGGFPGVFNGNRSGNTGNRSNNTGNRSSNTGNGSNNTGKRSGNTGNRSGNTACNGIRTRSGKCFRGGYC